MHTWVGTHNVGPKLAQRGWFLLGIALLGVGVGFGRSGTSDPALPPLDALDPMFLQAVTASISQHDVKAILTRRRTSGPVHIRLYSTCDTEQRCIIFSTMDFTDTRSSTSTMSLRVAVSVMPEATGAPRAIGSPWQVRTRDRALNASATYGGDFSDLSLLPAMGDDHAIASLLISIHFAINHALDARPARVST